MPLLEVPRVDGEGGLVPGAGEGGDAAHPLEVELAADLRIRPARVRNVVGVEGHHVAEDI